MRRDAASRLDETILSSSSWFLEPGTEVWGNTHQKRGLLIPRGLARLREGQVFCLELLHHLARLLYPLLLRLLAGHDDLQLPGELSRMCLRLEAIQLVPGHVLRRGFICGKQMESDPGNRWSESQPELLGVSGRELLPLRLLCPPQQSGQLPDLRSSPLGPRPGLRAHGTAPFLPRPQGGQAEASPAQPAAAPWHSLGTCCDQPSRCLGELLGDGRAVSSPSAPGDSVLLHESVSASATWPRRRLRRLPLRRGALASCVPAS